MREQKQTDREGNGACADVDVGVQYYRRCTI